MKRQSCVSSFPTVIPTLDMTVLKYLIPQKAPAVMKKVVNFLLILLCINLYMCHVILPKLKI